MPGTLKQFTKNIFSGWSALLVRTVITLAVSPVYIHLLGNDQYGIWVLGISIMNYTTLLDFGLRQAIIRFVSKYLQEDNYEKINGIIHSAFMLSSFAAMLTILFSVTISFIGIDLFNIAGGYEFTARLVLLIVGLDTAINFLFMAWGGSLGAFHRYDYLNGVIIAENILKAITLVLILKSGHGLIYFAAVFPFFSLLRNIVSAIILKMKFPRLKFGVGRVSEEAVRQLYRFGAVGFLISLSWLFIDNMDRILIGYLIDTETVTIFSVATVIMIFMRQFVLSASLPLRPVISSLESSGEMETIRHIYISGTKYLAWLTFSFAGGVFIFAESFIYLWMGPGYGESARILRLLVFPYAFYFSQAFGISIFYGTETHRKLLYLLIFEGAANFILSVILVQSYGVTGIILGTIIPQVPVYMIILPLLLKTSIGFSTGQYLKGTSMSILMASLATLLIAAIMETALEPSNWLYFAVDIAAVGVISIYGGIMILGRKDFHLLKEYYRSARDNSAV